MPNTYYPRARSKDLVVQTIADEVLVYDIVTSEAHCLNETAAFVWSLCNGKADVDEIADSVRIRYGRSANIDLINLALTQLADRQLLRGSDAVRAIMPSRRDVIKKIGLASTIAIPLIASVVSPSHALGSISCGGCTSPGSCFSMPACGNKCDATGVCVPS